MRYAKLHNIEKKTRDIKRHINRLAQIEHINLDEGNWEKAEKFNQAKKNKKANTKFYYKAMDKILNTGEGFYHEDYEEGRYATWTKSKSKRYR